MFVATFFLGWKGASGNSGEGDVHFTKEVGAG